LAVLAAQIWAVLLFLADKLGKKFGQQFFSGPRYIVNFQLPAVGRTSKKHTICTTELISIDLWYVQVPLLINQNTKFMYLLDNFLS